jgi:hypothetical protein
VHFLLHDVASYYAFLVEHMYGDGLHRCTAAAIELSQHISSDLGTDRSVDAWINELWHMYGDGLHRCTAAAISRENAGNLNLVKENEWKEECATLHVAIDAQSFVKSLVDELAHVSRRGAAGS